MKGIPKSPSWFYHIFIIFVSPYYTLTRLVVWLRSAFLPLELCQCTWIHRTVTQLKILERSTWGNKFWRKICFWKWQSKASLIIGQKNEFSLLQKCNYTKHKKLNTLFGWFPTLLTFCTENPSEALTDMVLLSTFSSMLLALKSSPWSENNIFKWKLYTCCNIMFCV